MDTTLIERSDNHQPQSPGKCFDIIGIMRNILWAEMGWWARLLRWFLMFIADIQGSPTQRFCPSTQAILLRRKPMQRNSDDLATNAEKSGQLDAVERSFSRLTHCSSSPCGIVRPASTSPSASRVLRSFSASDRSGRKANSSSPGKDGTDLGISQVFGQWLAGIVDRQVDHDVQFCASGLNSRTHQSGCPFGKG